MIRVRTAPQVRHRGRFARRPPLVLVTSHRLIYTGAGHHMVDRVERRTAHAFCRRRLGRCLRAKRAESSVAKRSSPWLSGFVGIALVIAAVLFYEGGDPKSHPTAKPGSARLRGVDLSGQRLLGFSARGADLTGSTLEGADLPSAALDGAALAGANLSKVNLTAASVTGSNLIGTNLNQAILVGADFARSDLSGACLHGADLRAADLSKAALVAADLRGADLRTSTITGAEFRAATYDASTLWPSGHSPSGTRRSQSPTDSRCGRMVP